MTTKMRTERVIRNVTGRTMVSVAKTCGLSEAVEVFGAELDLYEGDEIQLVDVTREWKREQSQIRGGRTVRFVWRGTDNKRSEKVVDMMVA